MSPTSPLPVSMGLASLRQVSLAPSGAIFVVASIRLCYNGRRKVVNDIEQTKVSRIVETRGAKAADEYVKIGWKTLAFAPGEDEDGTAYVLYSLGWSSENGDAKFPQDAKYV